MNFSHFSPACSLCMTSSMYLKDLDFIYWCLNRHLCILPECFAKKDLNLVIVCRKDVMS